MTTTTIDSGTVSVEDGTKPAEDYAPARKVRVELNFTLDQSDTDETARDKLAFVADLARKQVDQLLGRAPASQQPKVDLEQGVPAAKTRKARAPVAPAADPAAIEDPQPGAGAGAAPSPSKDAAAVEEDPSAVVDTETTTTATKTSGGAATPDPAAVADEWEVAPATEITDATLNAKVQERNGELKDSVKIRNLIGTFNPDPTRAFTLREIPAAQRQDFLDKLASLV